MPRNGSGVYSPPGANYPAVSGTLITAANRNAVDADIATALTGSIAVNGESVVTANIPFAGNKLTGIGAATARTDAASIATIQDGTGVYVGTVGGTADVITLTPSPAIASYVAGQLFSFIASGANTTNVTVNVSGLGAKAITKNGTTALVAGDIPSGFLATVRYDGTRFQLVGEKNDITTIQTQIQAQTPTFFTTAGTSTAYTLTPSPALGSLTTGHRFNVKFNATAGATPTLAISGLTAKSLKLYDSTGTKVAASATSIIANMIADVVYDGTDYVILDALPPTLSTAATTTSSGIVELATTAEMQTGTDTTRAVTVESVRLGAIVQTAVVTLSSTTTTITTSIPTWAKVIFIQVSGMSTSGTSIPILRLGVGGTAESTNYLGCGSTGTSVNNGTTGASLGGIQTAAYVRNGLITLAKMEGSNTWNLQGVLNHSEAAQFSTTGYSKALAGVLDSIFFTTVNGTDTFDGGTVSVSYL